MTAVQEPAAPVVPPPRGRSEETGGTGPGALGDGVGGIHRRVAVLVVLACVLIGGAAGYGAILAQGGQYRSTSTVVFTSTQSQEGDVSAGSRFVQARIDSYAQIASSEAVRLRAAEIGAATGAPFDPATIEVAATALSGTEVVELTATSPDADAVPAQSTAVARALIELVTASERFPGLEASRVEGALASPGGPVVDYGSRDGQWWAVLGAVAGFVLGLGACSLLRPGVWARDVAPQPIRSRRRSVDLNARAMGDELQGLVAALRTSVGKITVGVTALGIAGWGVTGSMIFPLAVVLAAGVWGWHRADARWPAAALIFTGVGLFPEKVDVIKLGPVTPTVLEVALLVAMVVALRQHRPAPRGAFTGPILAISVAVVVGCVVGLVRGGDFSGVADNGRAILLVLSFFPIYAAFARRPHQLIATMLAIAGVCSSVVVVAAVAGWSRLLVDERSSVITGESTSSVARLSGPVLDMWAPLLIILLSALVPRRPRWLWLALVVVGVLHQAASFNRSTWAPLIVLIVAVAAVTHGPRGLVRRLLGLTLVGVVGLALAFGGVLGEQGRAIAERATSVVTGQAFGEDSLPDRLRENNAAITTLHEEPWFGTGVGQPYGGELITYDSEHSRTVVEERPYIHNQYLRIWLFMGILGLFAYAFAGVRIAAVTAHAWWRRAAGVPMVVAVSLGLVCLAAQSTLQTTLVSRPMVLTTVTLMAAMSGFATWAPWHRGTGEPAVGAANGTGPDPSETSDRRSPAAEPSQEHRSGEDPSPAGPRRPASRAGTLEE